MTCVVSFPQNSLWVLKELQRQHIDVDIYYLYTKGSQQDDVDEALGHVLPFGNGHPFMLMRSLYHLATSKIVLIDNYFPFLAAVTFKKGVECIQLWHAVGAIKTFGLKDRSIHHRSEKARERFKKVYRRFDKIVVGSDTMAEIFMEAFGLPESHILKTGVPRTDLFFDKAKQEVIQTRLYRDLPVLKEKKILLYTPTYRDGELDQFNLQIDLDMMRDSLAESYVLLIKLHPAIRKKTRFETNYPGFVYDYSSYPDVNDLLFITDILITDYSSIAHEFSLFNKPMIFFPYDLETYTRDRGLWVPYDQSVTGPIVYSTEEMINKIKHEAFDLDKVRAYSEEWNRYSDGHSSERLVDYLSHRLITD